MEISEFSLFVLSLSIQVAGLIVYMLLALFGNQYISFATQKKLDRIGLIFLSAGSCIMFWLAFIWSDATVFLGQACFFILCLFIKRKAYV